MLFYRFTKIWSYKTLSLTPSVLRSQLLVLFQLLARDYNSPLTLFLNEVLIIVSIYIAHMF
jgi:hypothetical protein